MLLNWHHLIASAVSSQYFSVYLEGSMVIAFVCPSTFIRLIIEVKGGSSQKMILFILMYAVTLSFQNGFICLSINKT